MRRVDPDALARALAARPADARLREEAARALAARGRHAEAAALLTASLVNLTGHTRSELPCLCRRCLDPRVARASAGSVRFAREFAVSDGRVLFFWVPEALARDLPRVRASVREAMASWLDPRRQLRRRRARGASPGHDAEGPIPRINPFVRGEWHPDGGAPSDEDADDDYARYAALEDDDDDD